MGKGMPRRRRLAESRSHLATVTQRRRAEMIPKALSSAEGTRAMSSGGDASAPIEDHGKESGGYCSESREALPGMTRRRRSGVCERCQGRRLRDRGFSETPPSWRWCPTSDDDATMFLLETAPELSTLDLQACGTPQRRRDGSGMARSSSFSTTTTVDGWDWTGECQQSADSVSDVK